MMVKKDQEGSLEGSQSRVSMRMGWCWRPQGCLLEESQADEITDVFKNVEKTVTVLIACR